MHVSLLEAKLGLAAKQVLQVAFVTDVDHTLSHVSHPSGNTTHPVVSTPAHILLPTGVVVLQLVHFVMTATKASPV